MHMALTIFVARHPIKRFELSGDFLLVGGKAWPQAFHCDFHCLRILAAVVPNALHEALSVLNSHFIHCLWVHTFVNGLHVLADIFDGVDIGLPHRKLGLSQIQFLF